MKIKVTQSFLGIPRDAIGEIVEFSHTEPRFSSSCKIKFDCKQHPVHVSYPLVNYYEEVIE